MRVDKARRGAAANVDPFEGMQTWSQRYTKRRRMLPRMEARSHGMSVPRGGVTGVGDLIADMAGGIVLKFFPKELWSTVDPKAGLVNGAVAHGENRRAKMGLGGGAAQVEGRMLADGEEVEEGVKDGNNEEEDAMEDVVVDDEFEEDEDEGGDYNAEGYFDDGGDDAGDFGGDDGDGGDYF